jgi:uncharacterized protein YjbI with pentapeptide repeats
MEIDRRNLLVAAAAATIGTSQAVHGHEKGKRVSQPELDEAIRLHGMWLADMNSGQRCMFGRRDLSGLQFGTLGGAPIDLNGADFTQADFSETEADDILVHHCNFNGAKFDGCRWRQPVFAFADMRRVSAKKVEWGNSARRGAATHFRADFRHAVLNDADLTNARICGYFYGTRLGGASLMLADLSWSDFLGPTHHEMSLAGGTIKRRKVASLQDILRKLFSCRLFRNRLFTLHTFGHTYERLQFKPRALSGRTDRAHHVFD